jgi:hypothetical protein
LSPETDVGASSMKRKAAVVAAAAMATKRARPAKVKGEPLAVGAIKKE